VSVSDSYLNQPFECQPSKDWCLAIEIEQKGVERVANRRVSAISLNVSARERGAKVRRETRVQLPPESTRGYIQEQLHDQSFNEVAKIIFKQRTQRLPQS